MKKAFTLIELLVVIAIIAILAAMLMPALARAREEARKGACKGNGHNIGLAQAMYRNDFNTFPPYTGTAAAPPSTTYVAVNEFNLGALYPGYVEAIQTFDCPGGATNSAIAVAATYNVNAKVTNSDYLSDDVISAVASGSRVVMADMMGNHKDGSNGLFKDAHVAWVPVVPNIAGAGAAAYTYNTDPDYQNPELPTQDSNIYYKETPGGINDASLQQL